MVLCMTNYVLAPTQDDQYAPNIDPYQQRDEAEVAGEGGLKARAIYDYQASK